eukprot:gb/GEZJ01006712.1/.p2 GENE.gb/GEZJ01006712.1/~~gb/GEZJ01006712.1/.p2  ORF type:complete len:161 (-),score=8.85 gb/GEZJ01006712.1/:425-907(-)
MDLQRAQRRSVIGRYVRPESGRDVRVQTSLVLERERERLRATGRYALSLLLSLPRYMWYCARVMPFVRVLRQFPVQTRARLTSGAVHYGDASALSSGRAAALRRLCERSYRAWGRSPLVVTVVEAGVVLLLALLAQLALWGVMRFGVPASHRAHLLAQVS